MDYRIERATGGPVVYFIGRLSFADAAMFQNIAETIRKEAGQSWRLVFEELEFIDSAGLGMLLMVRDLVSRGGGSIRVGGATGQVRKALDLARFGELMTIET